MAGKKPFDSLRLSSIKRVSFFDARPACPGEIDSIIEEGLRLNTITPEEAEHIRSLKDAFAMRDAAQWVAHRNIQAEVIDGILRRAVRLNVVTPEEAASVWAAPNHENRYFIAQCIARRNVAAIKKQYDDSSAD